MKLHLDPEDAAFRAEVRSFLSAHLPPEVIRRSRLGIHPPQAEDRLEWGRALYANGWAAPHWPKQYGGTGWSPLRAHLFEYECRIAGAPELRWQGLKLIGPVIYTFGSDAQRARFLPGILKGETTWAQGFSEPGAGSDLASLRTSAVLDGAHYVLNGQKMWTTEANESDWGFFLVRTDNSGKPQRGISMIVLDMQSPGVTVRGIPTINGGCATWEVFLENVRVPAEQLIGAPGSGWDQGKFLLSNERTASADIEKSWADLRRIRRIAAATLTQGRPLLEDRLFTSRLNELELLVEALEWSVLRVLCNSPSAYPAGARASMLKVRGAEIQQRLNELAVDALGASSLRLYLREEAFATATAAADAPGDPLWPPFVPGVTADLLYQRALTIYGGAREVQKNLISKLAFAF